jgi:hypothetical protein
MLVAAGAMVFALDSIERPADARAVAATAPAPAAAAGSPVLVELFTSQGCSSCPPADALLSKLDAGGGVVTLSRPVTYWDRLGWKDTLARPANDLLQRSYAARGLPDSGVYTPEAVVHGSTAAVGSDERKLRGLIAAARSKNAVTLTQAGDRVTASRAVPGTELRFVAVAKSRAVKIVRGENGGRAIGYTNVVLSEAAMPCASSGACSAAIPAAIAGQKGADRWAAVLQDKGGGRVQAVRWINRPAK